MSLDRKDYGPSGRTSRRVARGTADNRTAVTTPEGAKRPTLSTHPDREAIRQYLATTWANPLGPTSHQMAAEIGRRWSLRVHPYTVARWGHDLAGPRPPGRHPTRTRRCEPCGGIIHPDVPHQCGRGAA